MHLIDIKLLEPKMNEAAALMTMLSQPARLRILCILLESEQSVLELAKLCAMSQPAMSHHLKKLRDAGLVQTRRSAQTIHYALKGDEVKAVMQTLHDLYCK